MAFLVAHVVTLLLAASSFTVATGLFDGEFQWESFRYLSQSGWGAAYPFPYSLAVVLAYLSAYALGVVAYWMIWRSGSSLIGLPGVLLCSLGFASFAFELTHWVNNHYWTWIASAPVAAVVLAVITGVQQTWQHKTQKALPAPV